LRAALAEGRSEWRCAIDGLRPISDALWAALSPTNQARFLRHLRPYWEVHRHRMAVESCDLLLSRMTRGLLSVEAGRIRQVALSSNGADVTQQCRHADEIQSRHYDWVVNCTPPALPLDRPTESLTRHLLHVGLARPHPSGLGYDVDSDGTLRRMDGTPVEGLYALGPPRRGHAIEATAVPHIRPQTEALSRKLLVV
jgi:uncharacterized NAD(P)/FAD-binding protein YdhS